MPPLTKIRSQYKTKYLQISNKEKVGYRISGIETSQKAEKKYAEQVDQDVEKVPESIEVAIINSFLSVIFLLNLIFLLFGKLNQVPQNLLYLLN